MPAKKPPLTEEEIDQMVELYRGGELIEDLARRFKTHTKKVSAALKGRGLNLKYRHKETRHPDFSEQACLRWLQENGFR